MATATISGTTDQEDAEIRQATPNSNFGGTSSALGLRWNRLSDPPTVLFQYVLARCVSGAIPAGTVSALRHIAVSDSAQTSRNIIAYKVLSGNAAYLEGTASSSVQTGSCCWAYLAYDATTPTGWAGSAGLSTAETDYTATGAVTVAGASATNTPFTFNLPAAWATDWRDTPANNGGILLRLADDPGAGVQYLYSLRPSEDTISPLPYWEVDTTAGGVSAFISRPSAFSYRKLTGG